VIANLGKKYPEAHETYCFSGRHLLLSFLDNAAPDVSLLRTFPGCFYPRCAGASDHPTQYVVCNYYVRSTSCVSCSAADNEHTCWLMHYPPLTHTSGIVESIASRFFPLVTVVLLRSLLNRLTRRIPYAEPDDLATILFSAQHYCSRGRSPNPTGSRCREVGAHCDSLPCSLPYSLNIPVRITHLSDPCVQQSRRSRKVATGK
jgi:hypothetical protein